MTLTDQAGNPIEVALSKDKLPKAAENGAEDLSQRAKSLVTRGIEGSLTGLRKDIEASLSHTGNHIFELRDRILTEVTADLEELVQLTEGNRMKVQNALDKFALKQKERTKEIARALDMQANLTADLDAVFQKLEL